MSASDNPGGKPSGHRPLALSRVVHVMERLVQIHIAQIGALEADAIAATATAFHAPQIGAVEPGMRKIAVPEGTAAKVRVREVGIAQIGTVEMRADH